MSHKVVYDWIEEHNWEDHMKSVPHDWLAGKIEHFFIKTSTRLQGPGDPLTRTTPFSSWHPGYLRIRHYFDVNVLIVWESTQASEISVL